MEFIIDHREKIKQLLIEKNLENTHCDNLDIGDYLFKLNDENFIIIERKTIEDLASSIKDGRYREQKSRLLQHFNKNQIIYIIEGDLLKNNRSFHYNKVSKSTIYSSLINLGLRDGICMFHTNNPLETIELLENIYFKIKKQGKKFLKTSTTQEDNLLKSYQMTKSSNITPKLVYQMQLCTIPGISKKYALAIMEAYPDLRQLVQSLILLESDKRIELVKNIKYKNGDKFRRVGKKVAENLDKFMFS
jgi:crossover junction endonuclease MUS81